MVIAGVNVYSVGEQNTPAVVLVTDVYGYRSPGARSNADIIAAAGFHVVVPDLFNGEDVAAGQLDRPGGLAAVLKDWFVLACYQSSTLISWLPFFID